MSDCRFTEDPADPPRTSITTQLCFTLLISQGARVVQKECLNRKCHFLQEVNLLLPREKKHPLAVGQRQPDDGV